MEFKLKKGSLFHKDIELTKNFKIVELDLKQNIVILELKADYDAIDVKADLLLMLKGMRESELIDLIDEAKGLLWFYMQYVE